MWVRIFTNLYKLQLNLGKGLVRKSPQLWVNCRRSLCNAPYGRAPGTLDGAASRAALGANSKFTLCQGSLLILEQIIFNLRDFGILPKVL